MPRPTLAIDTIIAGGGIAGLWLLRVLGSRGYSAVLFEAETLGGGQTLSSQGIIHGGIKYALGGALTTASEAMSLAPGRWQACLEGAGEVDLRGLDPLCERVCLFAGEGRLDRMAAFFASKTLHGRVGRLDRDEFPPALRHDAFRGTVYGLPDFVLDSPALIERLGELGAGSLYRHRLCAEDCTLGQTVRVRLTDCTLSANRLILAAGAGNDALLQGMGLADIAMQRRPLQPVIVRHPGLPRLFGHWLSRLERAQPRLTITTHWTDGASTDGGPLWHLGGQLASDGAGRGAQAQQERARLELETCFPWMDWNLATFETWRIDRAEARQRSGLRPDRAFAQRAGACIVCWPTKLSLTPHLADEVLHLMPPPEHPPPGPLNLQPARIGRPPWIV